MAAAEAGHQRLPVEVAPDEDQSVEAGLAGSPRPVCVRFEEHVHPLEDHPLGGASEIQDALAAEEILSPGLQQLAQPGVEALGIQFGRVLDANARHRRVVLVAGSAKLLRGGGLQQPTAKEAEGRGELFGPVLGVEQEVHRLGHAH